MSDETVSERGVVPPPPEWEVLTPEYDAPEDYIEGHCLYVPARDWVVVEARTRREAVSLAVKQWLAENGGIDRKWQRFPNYVQQRKQDGLCPFTGIRATEWADD